MPATTTLRALSFDEADAAVHDGASFVDLRRTSDYLEGHIPGSLAILYEPGPGMATRARDCIPLGVPLLLIEVPRVDMEHAAASLRGKGFAVSGVVPGALDAWTTRHAGLVHTVLSTEDRPPGGTLVDVGDPRRPDVAGVVRLPVERMWSRAHELSDRAPLVIATGAGVRAAMAVGMLERAGIKGTALWRPRRKDVRGKPRPSPSR